MDTTPNIMQSIRIEMRRGREADLSIPQFRTMGFIQRHPDSSLSDLADHLGLTLPSVSKLVDGLVKQKLISRQESTVDRRRLTLVLTPNGESIVNSARAGALAHLTRIMSCLSNDELATIHRAMELLNPLFVSQGEQPLVKNIFLGAD
ncbi:MAG TPA: MarR family winged helix-turn-helix transcriptional regulator [Anaerolineales bacterium]|nr:MarR family winged helix-turn-helix transcriptional regulator [Anaerolineales bacterium]